jgi:acetylornithine deacetylase
MVGGAMDAREMLARLIAFDTTSRNSNLALIEFVRDYLDALGVASELVFNEERTKANLYATIGPATGDGIMLSGHTDVVPVDGQDWHSDPFQLTENDGLLYGRGTSDMKGFVAVLLALVPEMVRRNLQTPLHLALSYDEEAGCLGARTLIAALQGRAERPRLCIIGEPTEMRVVNGHKGKQSLRVHVHGHEVHSSLTHLGVNAVEAAADLVAQLRRMARRKREEGPFDHEFAPPYTTIHTGIISGGTALNIVPRECHFDFEMRLLPSEPAEPLIDELRNYAATHLLPEMQAVQPQTGIQFEPLNSYPPLSALPDDEVTQLALAVTGANGTGKVGFGTEGGLFQAAGIPTIVCGPGSIEQAHKPDEFVAPAQLAACDTMLRRLLDRVSG